MSDRMLVTGQSEVAGQIIDALGLKGLLVRSLQLKMDAESPISVEAVFYPTKEQVETLGLETEKFRGFGRSVAEVKFVYDQEFAYDQDEPADLPEDS